MVSNELKTGFFNYCKHHDFWYEYSDDSKFWHKGKEERDTIKRLVNEHPELGEIWSAFLNYYMNVEYGDKPEKPKLEDFV